MIGVLYWLAALSASVSQIVEPSREGATASQIEVASAPVAQSKQAIEPLALAVHRILRETPVKIVIDETMLSDKVAQGDRFPIHLAEPVITEGLTLLPAGIKGEGEVIDAKRSSGGGAGGGIVANARFLMCGSTRVALGKMHVTSSGRDSYGTAIATTAAVGVFGMLVKGHNGRIQQGTLADAKIIADVDVPASC